MDVTDGAVFLRLHGEHLQRLTTELTTALSALEDALKEQPGDPLAAACVPIQRVAKAEQLLSTETESFGQRFRHFLRDTLYAPGS